MGVASLVLGIVSIVLAFMPFFWLISFLPALVGLILGIISLCKKTSKGLSIAGIVICSIVCILVFASYNNLSNPTGVPTTYTSTGTQNNTNVEDLKANIQVEALGIAKNGDFTIKVKNNNNVPVCIDTISTIYKDANGNFIKKANSYDSFFGIDANSETVVYNFGYDEDFSQYPNYEFEFNFANIADDFLYNNFEITANNTGKQIAVQVKNNNEQTIESLKVNVVYYQNGQVIGIEQGYSYEAPTNSGSSSYINVEYPQDSKYNELKFDDYKVYFVQASLN